jgi:hypothetical protein
MDWVSGLHGSYLTSHAERIMDRGVVFQVMADSEEVAVEEDSADSVEAALVVAVQVDPGSTD